MREVAALLDGFLPLGVESDMLIFRQPFEFRVDFFQVGNHYILDFDVKKA